MHATALLTVRNEDDVSAVLTSPVPVLICVTSSTCASSRIMLMLLREKVSLYAGQLQLAVVKHDAAPQLTARWKVRQTPTLIALNHGQVITRVNGFLSPELLTLLCQHLVGGTCAEQPAWKPTEEAFEDAVIVPLLRAAGLGVTRQARRYLGAIGAQRQRRVDMLVFDPPNTQPFTLIENKRWISGETDLHTAAEQANTYARALWLPAFIVAAPTGMWIYKRSAQTYQCIHTLSSLEMHLQRAAIPKLIYQLRFAGT